MKNYAKHIIGIMALAMAGSQATAQSLPNSFNYQAVINAEDGSPVSNKDITVEVSILQGNDCENSSCPVLWQELHSPTTNDFGLFSVEIGADNAINTTGGTLSKYSDIDWLNTTDGYYYLKVRVDFGESSYLNGLTDLGTTKFSAVPYSLVALTTDVAERAKALTTDANGNIAYNLTQLGDVDITSPVKNQVLQYDGSSWKNVNPEKTEVSLGVKDLEDVDLTTLSKNNVLTYNGNNWSNTALTLGFLSDVNTTGETNGDVLTYDGTSKTWIPQKVETGSTVEKITDLTDVTTSTTLADGHVLQYNSTSKKWVNADPFANSIWKTKGSYIYTGNTNKVGIGPFDPNLDDPTSDAKTPQAELHIYNGSDNLLITPKGITIGKNTNQISGDGSISLGGSITGTSCIVGLEGKIDGQNIENSIVMGRGSLSKSTTTLVVGQSCEISNMQSANSALLGLGLKLSTSTPNSLTCGKYNDPKSNALFMVGNGSDAARSNAFVVYSDGTAELNGAAFTSDLRLKTHISTLNNSVENVMKLRGVTFNWNKSLPQNASASDKLQYGFIAQEVEKVFPTLVNTDSNGYKSINYIGIIPVLTEAVKEQQEEIKTLKEENEQLKSTLEDLLKRVKALENK